VIQSDDCLILFAKEPAQGMVKTRLAREIGEVRATSLYEALLRDSVERFQGVGARLAFAFSPAKAAGFFAELAPGALLLVQPEGDLGARLASAFERAFDLGFERVAAVGSDAPHVDPGWIEGAFERLREVQLVIGPTTDGGYWLIGLSRPAPGLFQGVRWGSRHVLDETRRLAEHLRLDLAELPETFDVDRPEDLAPLRQVAEREASECPHTRAWFERGEHL